MAHDKTKLPPALQKILADLEAKGIKAEVLMGPLPPEFPQPTDTKQEATSSPSSQGYPPFGEFLSKMADVIASSTAPAMSHLHDHLCPRIKKLEQDFGVVQKTVAGDLIQLNNENQRLNEIVDNLMARVAALTEEHGALAEAHRKQVGLLHRRVTKRKGEIKVVKTKQAATKGRVTRLANKVDHSAS